MATALTPRDHCGLVTAMLIATLIAAAALPPAPAPAGEAPVPREVHVFGDWAVSCDNGRRCQAVGIHPEGREFQANGILQIERGPEAEAAPTFRLVQAEGAPARLLVHGAALPARLTAEADGDVVIVPEDRGAFMEQVLYVDQIDMQDAAGAAIGQISIQGFRGAMLYIDEAQGRLHTRSALVRAGRRPAGDVPTPPPVPIVRIAPVTRETPLAIPAARIARLRRDSGCAIDEVGGPDEAETAALGGGRTLVLLACGMGAYNVTNVPFVATSAGRGISIEPAPFDIALEDYEEEEGHRVLINAAWDAAEMTISDFSKGRGFGDCGSRSTYGWDGRRFRLVLREEMPECRGSYVFLTTWRANVVR
jgi:hypothetical protein